MKGFHLGFDQILTTFKGTGTGSGKFRSDTRNGQRGISKEEDNFFPKICPWTEAFHFYFYRNFKKSWHNGKHSLSFSSHDITNPRKGGSFLDQKKKNFIETPFNRAFQS